MEAGKNIRAITSLGTLNPPWGIRRFIGAAMTEKTILSEDEHDQRQPAAARSKSSETLNDDVSHQNLNGGLQAWLGVVAGFCVFVNSW